ncbi:MAG: helix-turn-helix transcriptional regulator [Firmicutes bacterium]|jgi:transcriptional regulator with XRE-family HTH domain|nr:helix-turn-helix transcriptional regulator [Bacillota bacterium]
MNIALGLRIRALRRLKRVTQQELAARLGISATLLSYIERGLKKPAPMMLEKIARELDVPREELFIIRGRSEDADNATLPGGIALY